MDSAGPTTLRTIVVSIKQFFRSAAKAITGDGEEEPQPERRRHKEGGTESGVMRLAREFSRLFITTKQPRARQAMNARDAREGFREGAAVTRRDTMPENNYRATGADLSDTLALLSQWNDEDLANFDDDFANDHKYTPLNL
jgi:hypothetical protein